MSALLLDSGALIAVERNDRAMVARLEAARLGGLDLRTTGVIVAEVWRDGARQAALARLLKAVDILPVDGAVGRAAGVLLGRAGHGGAPDASLVAVARVGDRIATSDHDDIRRLVAAADRAIEVVGC